MTSSLAPTSLMETPDMSTDDTPPRAAFLARLDTAVTLLWDANRDDSEDAARPNDPEVDVWTAAANLSNTLRKYGDVVRDEVWDLLVPSADAVELHPAPAGSHLTDAQQAWIAKVAPAWFSAPIGLHSHAALIALQQQRIDALSRLLRGMARRLANHRGYRLALIAEYDQMRYSLAETRHGWAKSDETIADLRRQVAAAPETSDPTGLIRSPFTGAQQQALYDWQNRTDFHPFTCPNDGDTLTVGAHWSCQTCDYTQYWAHSFMAGEPAPASVPASSPSPAEVASRLSAAEMCECESCTAVLAELSRRDRALRQDLDQRKQAGQSACEAAARIDAAYSHGVPSGVDDPVTAADWDRVLRFARCAGTELVL